MNKTLRDSVRNTFKKLGFPYGCEAVDESFDGGGVVLGDIGVLFCRTDVEDTKIRYKLGQASTKNCKMIAHKNGKAPWLVTMRIEDFIKLFAGAYGVDLNMVDPREKEKSVSDIEQEAAAAGMSYGKYVAMKMMEKEQKARKGRCGE